MLSTSILDERIGELLDDMASPEPIPGSGAASGIVVGIAAALCAMAARASHDWADAKGAAAQAESLRHRATRLSDASARAYAEALAAFRLPEDLEREVRDATLGGALARAAEAPLALAETAADVAELAAVIAREGQPALRGDAVAASILAAAAARTAAALVAVNLGVVEDDPRLQAARSTADAAARSAERAERTVA